MKNFLLQVTSILLLTSIANGQSTEIYISDAGNLNYPPWQILKFDENGENPEVFIDSSLAWPQDILFLDNQGLVLISNLNTNQITKYNSSSGNYLGSFATGISGPTRMKIGDDSLLYVLQWSGNGKVKRYQLDGTFVDDFTNIGVSQSIGLDWDSTGNLYVSSWSGGYIRKFDTSGNDLGLFVNSNLSGPTNIWFTDNGHLLVTDYSGAAVKEFDSIGSYLGNFISGLGNAEGVDYFSNGDILIGNGATSSVKLFDSTGNYIQDFIASGAGNLLTPNAVLIRENVVVSVSKGEKIVTDTPVLKQNFPNPFNSITILKYRIRERGFVRIKVYDVLGNEVATLVNKEKPIGIHYVQFDGSNLSSGVYIYIFRASDSVQSRKMLLLR